MSYRRIMVPLDGSDLAAEALPHAQAVAACFDAELILYQVVADDGELLAGDAVRPEQIEALEPHLDAKLSDRRQGQLVDAAIQSLQELVANLALHQINARAEVDVGVPAASIVDYAAANDVDLIVMSTHGRTGLARWMYGSVADKVLRAAHCPVLLVRVSGAA